MIMLKIFIYQYKNAENIFPSSSSDNDDDEKRQKRQKHVKTHFRRQIRVDLVKIVS